MALVHYMQAKDSTDGELRAYSTGAAADYSGTGYPGPGTALEVALLSVSGTEVGIGDVGPSELDNNGAAYATAEALRTACNSALTIGRMVRTSGALAANDGYGGTWEIVSLASVASLPDDLGTCVKGTSVAAIRRWAGKIQAGWFGCMPSSTSSVNVTGFRAALARAALLAIGGIVELGTDTHFFNDGILVPDFVSIQGQGKSSTSLSFNHTSYGLKRENPVNGSHAVNSFFRDFWVRCTNGANEDGGLVDVCGTFLVCERVRVTNFRFGCILDQTEVSSFYDCEFSDQIAGGAGLWIVNGDDYTDDALASFSNVLSFYGCQFNQSSGTLLIADDGGYSHHFYGCNFNGGTNCGRFAGVENLTIENPYVESDAGFTFVDTKAFPSDTPGAGACGVVNIQGGFVFTVTGAAFVIGSGGKFTIQNVYGNCIDDPLVGGAVNCFQLDVSGCANVGNGNLIVADGDRPTTGRILSHTGTVLFDGYPRAMQTITGTSYTLATSASRLLRFSSEGLVTVTVPKAASQNFIVGTEIELRPMGAAGIEVVPVDGDVTLRVPDGDEVAQYKRGTLVKIASDEWVLYI